eukprot:CAMPEP_0178390262 /NCGR_PEP_ID=MMETSP0689_2-20121128/10554_1 /TAXON_ID=160604 /ORGANISM="Amphidinium massartii, Strain CS-259" /LENGTH=212 /DNA_ID=CAMNT_0020010763 /DNA_START=156 /DNA_END=794 /DNA_ORIENTATION=+
MPASARDSGLMFDIGEENKVSEVFLTCVLKGSKLEAALRTDPRSTDLIGGGQQIVSVNGEREVPQIASKLTTCQKVVIVFRTGPPRVMSRESSKMSDMSAKQEANRSPSQTSGRSSRVPGGTGPSSPPGTSPPCVGRVTSRRSSTNSKESEPHVSFSLLEHSSTKEMSELLEATASEPPSQAESEDVAVLEVSGFYSNTTTEKSGASVRMAL